MINISKERGCYTDFPFPQDAPSHCTARDVQDYLESYVEHFGLASRLRLGTNIQKVTRDEEADRWKLLVEGSDPLFFDKVVIATGAQQEPQIPDLPNMEKFSGNSVHSRSFKRFVKTSPLARPQTRSTNVSMIGQKTSRGRR